MIQDTGEESCSILFIQSGNPSVYLEHRLLLSLLAERRLVYSLQSAMVVSLF